MSVEDKWELYSLVNSAMEEWNRSCMEDIERASHELSMEFESVTGLKLNEDKITNFILLFIGGDDELL